MRIIGAAFVSMAGVSLASCMMGPDYKPPALDLPAAHRGADESPASESLADLRWFELFGDEQLTDLVAFALEHNFDARIAAERVLQARAALGITRGNQLPAVDALAGASAVRLPREDANGTIPPGSDTSLGYLEAGFSVGWELDVWGRLRRLSEAARAQYLATEEARRGVITTLIADVTDSYLALRTLDLELDIATRTRDAAADTLRLIEVRRTGGIASGVDLRQSEQLLLTARARIAGIEREIAQAENALNLLLGRLPGAPTRGRPLDAFEAPPNVPAGLPSSLLERRPDIRQAEQELVAANAQIGAIKADRFPRIALTGFLGSQSQALTSLLSGPAFAANAGLGVVAPLFDGGQRRANVALAEAVYREALVNYQRAVYTAFRDVADALAARAHTREQRAEQQQLVDALRESARLSNARYTGGLDSYLPVLDAERSLFLGELELARLRQQELSSIVQLYRALGGGWSES